ncbi:MAG: AEC family transporter [Rhodobacteraceae bacterium]|nr:AEC family transporter [Paracoccaceae bacterium]
MLVVFMQTLPFFALVGLGYGAVRTGIFAPEANAALTGFVFYFALSALLFRFAAQLSLAAILDWTLVQAYVAASVTIYLLTTVVAVLRGCGMAEAAVEAQCSVIGNVSFLGLPILVLLLGEGAAGPVLLVLSVDLIVFSSLIVILITLDRDRGLTLRAFKQVGRGLIANPMIVSIVAGLAWSAAGWSLPAPFLSFLTTLGSAATPGALFVIGASLAGRSAERLAIAGWLSACKVVLHPLAVALSARFLFPVAPQSYPVLVAVAAMPVAGNVYILAQHYRVAPQRASTAILLSTMASVATLPVVISLVTGG